MGYYVAKIDKLKTRFPNLKESKVNGLMKKAHDLLDTYCN